MAKKVGKVFEDNFRRSVPKHILYHRPPDAAQAFGGGSDALRFSPHSPCDCMLFDSEILITLELKTVGNTSISFERQKGESGVIHHYQIASLLNFSRYKNVVAGLLLDFRKSGNTYFVEINDFVRLMGNVSKKSFNEKDLESLCPFILVGKRKLKVNYRYDVEKLLEQIKKDYGG